MTCRNCEFYDVEAVKNKAGHVMKKRRERCQWTIPAVPASWPITAASQPQMNFMRPFDGEGCKVFKERILQHENKTVKQ